MTRKFGSLVILWPNSTRRTRPHRTRPDQTSVRVSGLRQSPVGPG